MRRGQRQGLGALDQAEVVFGHLVGGDRDPPHRRRGAQKRAAARCSSVRARPAS
jgi:hypothetical protein